MEKNFAKKLGRVCTLSVVSILGSADIKNLEYIGALNGLTQKEIRRRTQKIFNKFDGRTFFEPRFSDLSLGQRCIFGIFVATIISNGIILVDEPTSPLDSKNRESVYFMLKELCAVCYLIVDTTHDPTLAEISDVYFKLAGICYNDF